MPIKLTADFISSKSDWQPLEPRLSESGVLIRNADSSRYYRDEYTPLEHECRTNEEGEIIGGRMFHVINSGCNPEMF
jgi:hypothetical protein